MVLYSVRVVCLSYYFLSHLLGRLSYNKLFTDCAGAIFYSLMKLALETPHSSPSKFFNVFIISFVFFP